MAKYVAPHQRGKLASPTPTQTSCTYKLKSRVARATRVPSSELPVCDDFQKRLQQRIDSDLSDFVGAINKPSFLQMCKAVKAIRRFNWTCIVVSIENDTMSVDMPCDFDDLNLGGDTRRSLFRDMLLALDAWCARHGLAMPEADFVISVRDTYVWEKRLSALPWMVVAKPQNRKGVLVPDSSFLSHDDSNRHQSHSCKPSKHEVLSGKHFCAPQLHNETPLLWRPSLGNRLVGEDKHEEEQQEYQQKEEEHQQEEEEEEEEEEVFLWDVVKNDLSKSSNVAKQDVVFFKGADTTSDKCACRSLLRDAKLEFLEIDLLGSKQPMYLWAAKKFLLNLPGHQPWSYRRKYLHLLRSVVFHVDVVTHFSEQDVSLGWELFFDRLFEAQTDFVRLELHTFDQNMPNYQELNAKAFSTLVGDIQEAYQSKLCKPTCCVYASCRKLA